jgi:cytochrome c biogenesis factor
MNTQAVAVSIDGALRTLARLGGVFEIALLAFAAVLLVVSLVPTSTPRRRLALAATVAALLAGELLLAWFHWRLHALAIVVDPATGQVAGHVAIPLWVESEKLYAWALVVAVMGLAAREKRDELLPGIAIAVAALILGAALWGRPFTNPLPSFFGQYAGYLQAMAGGGQGAQSAYEGMESSRQFYYNAWYMWVHPPLLFFSYGAFVISFLATLLAIVRKHSSYERLAYHWARLGYLPLTAGMLLGFPWALVAWNGQSWWWSGKVNMSIMMWLLYTAYLHGRLYLRQRGMWRWVLALSVLSFAILVLTYLATYVVPGAHSYA